MPLPTGYPHWETNILQKVKLKKGHDTSHNQGGKRTSIVTWVNDTEHTKIIDKQCRLEVEKG